jgi:hypothetical protein
MATQLVCPHCGSALAFGTDIAAGTAVQCLICGKAFKAQAQSRTVPTQGAAPKPKPANPPANSKPVPKAATPASKPAPATAVTEKPRPAPTSPPQRAPSGGGKAMLAVVAIGLLLVLAGGIAFGIWKLNGNSDGPGPIVLNNDGKSAAKDAKDADGKNKDASGADTSKKIPKDGVKADDGGAPPPPVIEDDEETRRLKEAEKKLLQRKTPVKPDTKEIEPDPLPVVSTPPTPSVPGLDQKKINRSIESGLDFLKKSQNPDGAWGLGHFIGHAALGGLTMLECGLPATDMHIQRSATYVRQNLSLCNQNYEASLAILFLDRLGDPRDRVLIQSLALRILASQCECGGWSYGCNATPPDEMLQLWTFLHSHKPLVAGAKNPAIHVPLPRDPMKPDDPIQQFSERLLATSKNGKDLKPIDRASLPPQLQNLMVVKSHGKAKGKHEFRDGGSDNSNTQFALLALWAARRHDVPSDQAILAVYTRFMISQCSDGGWAYYHQNKETGTDTMTCVGLLGEAMGYGVAPEKMPNPKNPKELMNKSALDDPAVQKAFKKLASHIGEPSKDENRKDFPVENLYFLWSVERVAMLYDLKTVNGKDWYGWGAQLLVHTQAESGEWPSAEYHGRHPVLNTCFALLFLRRSNLVQDLTNNLRLHSAIRDPEK